MKIIEGDGVLLSQPLLIEQFGRAGAQFLSQLHYWLNHNQKLGTMSNGAKWIYNSAKDWADQLCMSSRTIQRLISSLNNSGVLEIKKLSTNKHNRTNHYTINYEVLENLINNKSKVLEASEKLIATKCRNASRQSDVMYIQRLPNKEINKSEEKSSKIITNKALSKNSLKQVKELKNINEKNREWCKESVSRKIDLTETNKIKNDIDSKQTSKTDVKEDSPKTNTAQAMLKAWNDTFSFSEKMSRELAPLLVSAYNSKFSKNIEHWQHYLLSIKSSAYLTSEKFNLSIFWALKFSSVDRIRAGEFGVKNELIEQVRVEKTLEEVKLEINHIVNEPKKAIQLRYKILDAIGVNEYLAWFHRAKFLENTAGEIYLEACNAFAESIWEQRYSWVAKSLTKQHL